MHTQNVICVLPLLGFGSLHRALALITVQFAVRRQSCCATQVLAAALDKADAAKRIVILHKDTVTQLDGAAVGTWQEFKPDQTLQQTVLICTETRQCLVCMACLVAQLYVYTRKILWTVHGHYAVISYGI